MANPTTPPLPLQPLELPIEPSIWPLALGWWLAIALVCIAIVTLYLLVRRYRQHRTIKREALTQLATPNLAPSQALQLVRQAAMHYFPRSEVASLSGEPWYRFLDCYLKEPRFTTKQAQWQQQLYQASTESNTALIEDCKHWVQHALPPKEIKHDQ